MVLMWALETLQWLRADPGAAQDLKSLLRQGHGMNSERACSQSLRMLWIGLRQKRRLSPCSVPKISLKGPKA